MARLFYEAGYEVIFVDVDLKLIKLLNERRSYPVVVKQNDLPNETHLVQGILAMDGRDIEVVIDAIVMADTVATSVGQRALQSIFSALSAALLVRKANDRPPLGLIIAENLRLNPELPIDWQFLTACFPDPNVS